MSRTVKMLASKRPMCQLALILLLIAVLASFACLNVTYLSSVGSEEQPLSSKNLSQVHQVSKNLLKMINSMATTSVGDLSNYIKNPDNDWWQTANSSDVNEFLNTLRARRNKFLNSSQALHYKRKAVNTSQTVYIATAACEKLGREEAVVMLKSAILFGQHTNIHAYIFTDQKSIVGLSLELLMLKWVNDVRGGNFSFRILEKTFPKGWNGSCYAPCATQRLFLPSALPEVDAVLYIDADTLFLSNLTRIWGIFKDMNATALAAMATNTEEGSSKHRVYATPGIPIYGNRGLNAGVILMNLTRMRDFKMEERAIAVNLLYGKKLVLADQDIYNIIFHFSPDKVHVMDCTHNFYYVHCLSDSFCKPRTLGSLCFCDSALQTGVKILHGALGSFNSSSFMRQAYQRFHKINLLAEDSLDMVQELVASFRKLVRPCPKLTAEALYGNAIEYLKEIVPWLQEIIQQVTFKVNCLADWKHAEHGACTSGRKLDKAPNNHTHFPIDK